MQRKIATLLIILALGAAVYSENVLKCYMCTSLSNEGCDSEFTGNSLQPVECTGNKMIEWQRSIEQHNVLSQIARFIEVDETLQHYRGPPHNMACAKMVLDMNQDANQDAITIRMCQMNKTEHIDPCEVIKARLMSNFIGKMKQCTLCHTEACNGTMGLSSEIFYILLSFFTLIHAFYHWA